MSISWKNFVDAFRIGSDTGNVESLAKMITNDFNWITSGMNRRKRYHGHAVHPLGLTVLQRHFMRMVRS